MGPLASAKPVLIIATRDRERAKPFYRDMLGLPLVSEDHFAAVFDVGGTSLRLSTVPDWVPSNHTVLGFVVANVAEAVTALKAEDVAFNIYEGFNQDPLGIWTAPDGTARVAWFKDFDGNVLSVTQF
ncbi:MAG TPA: VOC family protein [Rhizomicrobium sp.]|nr:VOC family protein [Rhizomicrobium sp.]